MLCGVGRRQCQPSSQWRFIGLLTRSYHSEQSPSLIDVSKRPDGWKETNATVYYRVIGKVVGNDLALALEKEFKLKRYSKSHWDAVIQRYREFTLSESDPEMYLPFQKSVFDPIRTLIREKHLAHRSDDLKWLPPHIIDLHKDGGISAHVDSTRFSGEVVCGLSLKSPCIMRLRPANEDGTPDPQQYDTYVDMLLEPLSLYVLQGDGRYKYTHEILPSNSIFNVAGENPRLVSREPRCSVIFRDDQ